MDIEIINKNIDKFKSSIRLERITLYLSLVNMCIMGSTLYKYYDEINFSTKFISMVSIGMCFTLSGITNEKIKDDKFKMDELLFEKEKLEEKSK